MRFIKKLVLLISVLPLLAGCAGGLNAFNKGQKLEKQGKLDEAIMKYAEAAAANPDAGEYRMRLLKASEESARVHFKRGEDYRAARNYDDAVREYQTAYTLDSSLDRAVQMSELAMKLRNSRRFQNEGEEFEKNRKMREALTSYKKAAELDPENTEAKAAVDRLLKSRKTKLDGFELNFKSTKPITLKFRDAKIKEVFNILSQLSGINFVFDEGMKDSNVTIFLENATFYQAMEILTGMNKLGRKVLNESTIIIYAKTPEKDKQYEELKVQTFMLNKLDAKKAVNLIRTMLPAKKIYVNEDINALVMRDTPESIEVARKVLEANDIPDAELVLDVEIIEISKSNTDNFGLVLSKYAVSTAAISPNGGSTFLSDSLTTTSATGSTVTASGPTNLLQVFNWRGFSGFLTVPNATYNFGKTLSKGQTLANPKIRVKNREKSKFNVGTRVPITTTSSPVGGGVSVNVQYVDVGVKVNAEPTIQLNNDINIKLGLEVSSVINSQTIGDSTALATVVTIGTRNLDTVLSLKDGETSIIGGLIQDNRTDSKRKISFLGDIPIIGPLLTGTNKTNDKTELILAITPHIVRGITAPDADVSSFWSGKEDDPSLANPYGSFEQEPDIPVPQPVPKAMTAAPAAMTGMAQPAAVPAMPATGVPAVPAFPAMPAAPAVPALPAAPNTPTAPPVMPVAPPSQGAPSAPPGGQIAPAPQTSVVAPLLPAAPGQAAAANVPSRINLNITAPSSIRVNDRFNINIVASNATDLNNALFVLSFDPALLDYDGASEGAFLKMDGKQTSFQATGVKNSGQVSVNLRRTGNIGGVTGSGVLAVLSFKAKAPGTAGLGFLSSEFTDAAGKSLSVTPFKAFVDVKQPEKTPSAP
jgi:general secretion pathway protein D